MDPRYIVVSDPDDGEFDFDDDQLWYFRGELFTGVAREEYASEVIETEYVDGLASGLFKQWRPDGSIEVLAQRRGGVAHGASWHFRRSGRPSLVQVHYAGVELVTARYAEDGSLESRVDLRPGDPMWELYEHWRAGDEDYASVVRFPGP